MLIMLIMLIIILIIKKIVKFRTSRCKRDSRPVEGTFTFIFGSRKKVETCTRIGLLFVGH